MDRYIWSTKFHDLIWQKVWLNSKMHYDIVLYNHKWWRIKVLKFDSWLSPDIFSFSSLRTLLQFVNEAEFLNTLILIKKDLAFETSRDYGNYLLRAYCGSSTILNMNIFDSFAASNQGIKEFLLEINNCGLDSWSQCWMGSWARIFCLENHL